MTHIKYAVALCTLCYKAQHEHNKVDVMCESVYCGLVIIDDSDRKYELVRTGMLNHMWGHFSHGESLTV